jgi:homogentisate 1,2-dioxygenase
MNPQNRDKREPVYQYGFGNEFQSEAIAGALPEGQFSPQIPAFGLYAEKFSSTAFTTPNNENRRTWFYRIRPSVLSGNWKRVSFPLIETAPSKTTIDTPPEPIRWDPPTTDGGQDFLQSITTIATNGSAELQTGIAIHTYSCGLSMRSKVFYNCDGELLLVPQSGALGLHTECGLLELKSGEIAIIPKGMKFYVELYEASARGYLCENYGVPLMLPERGLIGSDGLANARDFKIPTAAFEDSQEITEVVCKFGGAFFAAEIKHHPLDVVAWVGNSVPVSYDLTLFNTLGSVTYDHPDPSINTVLTSPSNTRGAANLDLVVFGSRWQVAENTFRPPWFHRNVMAEFMGLIFGQYDGKKNGFLPGGMSLHNSLVPHGPDGETTEGASSKELHPQRLEQTLAFMFETRFPLAATAWALNSPLRQKNYTECWTSIVSRFNPS